MVEPIKYMVDSYLDWAAREGVPIHEGFGLDLNAVETRPWARFGVDGAIVHVKGRGDAMTVFVLDLPPAGKRSAEAHLRGGILLCSRATAARWSSVTMANATSSSGATPACSRHRSTRATMQFHQHFNGAAEPVRYIAFTQGSVRYPMTAHMRRVYAKVDVDVKQGGNQIEYRDQDPRIHAIFVDELARKGVAVAMGEFASQ